MVLLKPSSFKGWYPSCASGSIIGETIDITTYYVQKRLGFKVVGFSPEITIIGCTASYTEEEKEKCFYRRDDKRIFDEDRRSTCMTFESKQKKGELWEETDDLTLRGLEDFFGKLSKEDIRKQHVTKVLKEQDRQRALADVCAETTRNVACGSSAQYKAKAILLAQRDAIAAQRYYKLMNA